MTSIWRHLIRRCTPLACLVSGTLVACGGERTPAAPDASGGNSVAIIDTTALVCSELFRPGDSLPPQINAASVGPKGMIAWQPVGKSMLIIRSPDGREVRIDGMAGDSRFASVAQMGWNGDTLWITDVGSNRIQRFTATGTSLGALLAPDIAGWRLLPSGMLRATAPRGFDSLGLSHVSWALIGAKPGSHVVDTVATLASAPWSDLVLPQGPELNPFSITSMAGMALDGSKWCITQPEGDGVHLVCLDATGGPMLDKVLGLPHRTVSAEVYQTVADGFARAARLSPDSMRVLFPRPDSLPFAFSLRFGHDGAPWILRSHRSEPEQSWLRLRPDGTPVDEVRLPARFFLLDFSGDSLWVAEREAASFQRFSQCIIRQ